MFCTQSVGKFKTLPVHAMKAWRGVEVELHSLIFMVIPYIKDIK